jgi:predicted PurR-regulated permease PerM
VALILVLTGLASLVYQPATSFLQDFPHHLRQIQERLTFLSASLKQAGHTSEQVEQLMGSNQNSETVVTLKSPGVIQALFSQTPVFSAKMIVVTILAYFLLAHREAFLLKAVKAVPTFEDKRRVVDIAREIQTSIASDVSAAGRAARACGFDGRLCVNAGSRFLLQRSPPRIVGMHFWSAWLPRLEQE